MAILSKLKHVTAAALFLGTTMQQNFRLAAAEDAAAADDKELDDLDDESTAASSVPGEPLVLTDASFKSELDKALKPMFVKFYAPWCGHCKAMAADWDKLAEQATGAVIAKVDATVEREAANLMKVRGFPTLTLFDKNVMYSYNGPRTLDAMLQFANGGYKAGSSKNLPWNESIVDKVKQHVEEYFTKVGQIMAFEPTILPICFFLGFFFAFIFFFLCCGFSSSSSPVDKKELKKAEKAAKAE
ncbi:unnamed protein product [Amoebophrya sp. A120]|nr:unnamed protein product [Amoebophrya sp. A120]|eukprot:GSA120T00005822001.1